MSDIVFRQMDLSEINRIGEVRRREVTRLIDVNSNNTSQQYGLSISLEKPGREIRIPDWSAEGVKARMDSFRINAAAMEGAFHNDCLIGFAITSELRTDRSAELIAIFLDVDHRHQGIGSELLSRSEGRLRAAGAEAIFAGSNPTESSLRFYLGRGFSIVGLTSHRIVPSLEGDVIVARQLIP